MENKQIKKSPPAKAAEWLKDKFYNLSVRIHKKLPRKSGSQNTRKIKNRIFYILMLAYPVAHFCVFYIGVNFNSVLLAFKRYNYGIDGAVSGYVWSGFDNFVQCVRDLFSLYYFKMSFKNSFIAFAVTVFLQMPLAMLFSYYVFKKSVGHKFFKIILFLPSVISAMVMTVVFKYCVEEAVPTIVEMIFNKPIQGLLSNVETRLATLLFYAVWASFGGSILLYSGTMSNINEAVLESARLEGAKGFKEVYYIILPSIFPTIKTFLLINIAGIFINQLGLYNFYAANAEYAFYTFGYYLYRAVAMSTLGTYPYLAAMGLLMTLVVAPVIFLIKALLERYGPSVD